MVMRTLMALQTGLGEPRQAIALNRELLAVVRDDREQARLKLNLAELLEQAAVLSPADAATSRREAIAGYQLALDSEELPPHERFVAGLRAAGLLQQFGDHSAAHQAVIAVADGIEALPPETRQRLMELDPGAPGRPGSLSLENTLATALLAAAKSGATSTVTGILERMATTPARAVPWPIWLVRVRAALGNKHDTWFVSYVEALDTRWSKDPTWPVVEYELADALQRSKRHVEAARILSDMVRRDALASVEQVELRDHYQREALFLLGMAIYDLGERESALTVFRQFLAAYPDDGRRNFVTALEHN